MDMYWISLKVIYYKELYVFTKPDSRFVPALIKSCILQEPVPDSLLNILYNNDVVF